MTRRGITVIKENLPEKLDKFSKLYHFMANRHERDLEEMESWIGFFEGKDVPFIFFLKNGKYFLFKNLVANEKGERASW